MKGSRFSKGYMILISISVVFLVTPYPLVSIAILLWGVLYYLDRLYELKKEEKEEQKKP